MKEPLWITREDVLAIHDMMLAQHGGRAGLREEGLLDSALHRPRQMLHYAKPSLHAMAAAYAGGIVKNHPFVDGNKRTGFMLAAVFLETHGLTLMASEESAVIHTLALASGGKDEKTYAAWLKESTSDQ